MFNFLKSKKKDEEGTEAGAKIQKKIQKFLLNLNKKKTIVSSNSSDAQNILRLSTEIDRLRQDKKHSRN
jgi:hypothetical protein